MKKQRIYSYLQRSLIKVCTKSNTPTKYTTVFSKSLKRSSASLTGDRHLHHLYPLLDQLSESRKKLKLFKKIPTKEKLGFKCHFFLISFNRPTIIRGFYDPASLTLLNFFHNSKVVKLNLSFQTFELANHFFDPRKQSLLFFCQSFYKKRKEYKNSIKIFQKLYLFFSVFSLNINTKMKFFNYAELFTEVNLVLQVLYKYNITYLNYSSFWLNFFKGTKSDIDIFFYLGVKKSILQEKQRSFLQLLFFLLIIFYVILNYIKKKEKFYKEGSLKSCFFQFNKITNILFLWFKPFFHKIIVLPKTSNLGSIFLMRPLFSVTRFDTFFICESLKLPIYPDKSNLRVDFLRNRVRKQILPTIRILLNPQFDTLLCKYSN